MEVSGGISLASGIGYSFHILAHRSFKIGKNRSMSFPSRRCSHFSVLVALVAGDDKCPSRCCVATPPKLSWRFFSAPPQEIRLTVLPGTRARLITKHSFDRLLSSNPLYTSCLIPNCTYSFHLHLKRRNRTGKLKRRHTKTPRTKYTKTRTRCLPTTTTTKKTSLRRTTP